MLTWYLFLPSVFIMLAAPTWLADALFSGLVFIYSYIIQWVLSIVLLVEYERLKRLYFALVGIGYLIGVCIGVSSGWGIFEALVTVLFVIVPSLIIIPIIHWVINAKEKKVSYLQERNWIKYEINSETPFTGKLVKMYDNNQKQREENHKDGRAHGVLVEWYENGQKRCEQNWKNNKLDGLVAHWYENGQKERGEYWTDGKVDGPSTWWYKNGQKNPKTKVKNSLIPETPSDRNRTKPNQSS